MWTSAFVAGVLLHHFSFSKAIISQQVTGSGSFRSVNLINGETYEYLFEGYPNADTLLLFNITKLKGLENGDFKIYGDPIVSDIPPCWVFERNVQREKNENPCRNLWKRKYGGCVLNKVFEDRCTVTFKKQGSYQELDVDYNIIDCNTGNIIMAETTQETPVNTQVVEETAPNTHFDTTLKTTEGPSIPEELEYGLSFFLPIAFSALFLIAVIVIVPYKCITSKRKPQDPEAAVQEVGENPVYEEIPELQNWDQIRREDPYNTLSREGAKEPIEMDEIPYNTLERQDRKIG